MGDGEAVGNGVEDALVGLVQQQPVELLGGGAGGFQQLAEDCRHLSHRKFVDLLAVHLDRRKAALLGRELPEQGRVFIELGKG